MKVALMQKIDYWLGVPLCFFLSVWQAVWARLFPARPQKPRKILFIELSEMGSAVLAYSSLQKAKSEFENAQVFFLIFKRNRESVDLLEVIPEENVITIREENLLLFAASFIAAMLKIRRLKIDSVIDMELFSRCTALISYLSGAANRVGFHNYSSEGLYRGAFLTHPVLYNHHQHMALNFLSLLYALKEPRGERPLLKKDVRGYLMPLPQRTAPAAETLKMRDSLRRANPLLADTNHIVVFNPDPGLLPLRGWPLENFSRLAQEIVRACPEALIVVVGLQRSKSYAESMGKGLPGANFLDFTGRTATLAELLVLLSIAKLLVTNDSGPAHMAALTPVQSLVLFGPETPALYGPLGGKTINFHAGLSCSPCVAASNHRRTFCSNNRCLQAIRVEDVLPTALKTLAP